MAADQAGVEVLDARPGIVDLLGDAQIVVVGLVGRPLLAGARAQAHPPLIQFLVGWQHGGLLSQHGSKTGAHRDIIHGVRIAIWIFMASVLACVVGVFLPAGELRVGDPALRQNRTISLYRLGKSKDAVRSFLTEYRDSKTRRIGAAVLDRVSPHLEGRLRSDAGDVQDAMAALDTIRDEDIETVGRITSATLWGFLALELIAGALLFGVSARTSRLRLAAAVGVALLGAAVGVAIHLVLGRVVAEANAELELSLFALRAGAYVIPVAAVAAAAATIAVLIGQATLRRQLSSPPPHPHP